MLLFTYIKDTVCQPRVNHSIRKTKPQPSPDEGKTLPSWKNSCLVETDYLAGVNFHIAMPQIIMLVINSYLLGYAPKPLGAKWKIIKSFIWKMAISQLIW